MDSVEQEGEAPYGVPSHLNTSGSIGWIPERTFYVGVAAFVLGALPAYVAFRHVTPAGHMPIQTFLIGAAVGLGVGLLPALILSPFAMWFLAPPVEHGLVAWLAYRFGKKELSVADLRSLRDIRIEGGVVHTPDGPRAILQLPTVNLDLASVAARRRHRSTFGHFVDGLSTHPFQFIVRTRVQSSYTSLERMRLHRNPFARKLADWLAEHLESRAAIDRRRYMVIPAPDVDTLKDRVDLITRTLAQAHFEAELLTEPADIREVLNGWWTWRPHPERLGPERVRVHGRYLEIDGEFVQVYCLSDFPRSIATNWWYPLIDGDLPIDVVQTCEQQDLNLAKWKLDMRYNGLYSSNASPSRVIALEQIKQLRIGFESKVRPWNMQVLFVVRANSKKAMERNARRLEQQAKDLGGGVRSMRWEHVRAMESAQPLCGPMMRFRDLYIESGTLARTTPLSASTLQMLDGVPWGMSGKAGIVSILLTTMHMRTGKHFGWFGFTGAGKGYGLRCYLARRYFADRLRLFMWDADSATHEYAGRFTTFLGGKRLMLNTLADVDKIDLDPLWQVVAFDVSGMPVEDQSQGYARVKLKVEQFVLAYPGPMAWVTDEATTLAEHPDQAGARALGDAVQRWRKYGVECHVVTQRVSDWFGTPLGRKVQGNLAVKWYGAQEDSELADVSRKVNWSSTEMEHVGGAGIGQGLLVAFGRRVWADLYGHTAPFEFAAYETEPAERVELSKAHTEADVAPTVSVNGRSHTGSVV